MIAALDAKLLVVKLEAEIVPDEIEIPEPAVNGACTLVPITSPRFTLASDAVVAPVPPFSIAIAVPLQVPVVIVPTVERFINDVKELFEVAVILPAIVAVAALPVVL